MEISTIECLHIYSILIGRCDAHIGNGGALSYVTKGHVHYPHITVGDEDLRQDGFHVTLFKNKHVFFQLTPTYPFCRPIVYDRVNGEELWSVFNYAKEFAVQLREYRNFISLRR